MPGPFQRYVGKTVDIIYLDRANHLSQRRIRVLSADWQIISAYCWERKAPRCFKSDNVLAVMPVKKHAG
jgi:predicted DNA-binding transcriptional regulator YafY